MKTPEREERADQILRMEMEPGGDSGGNSQLPRRRAACEPMPSVRGWKTWAAAAGCDWGVVARTVRKPRSGLAGAVQQDLASGACIAPQCVMGWGRQQFSAAIAAGATQATACPASIATASASTPPLRTHTMVASLCCPGRKQQVEAAHVTVTVVTQRCGVVRILNSHCRPCLVATCVGEMRIPAPQELRRQPPRSHCPTAGPAWWRTRPARG